MNVDSSVTHSNQNIETAQISTHFVEWINNCGIFMQWNNISSLKRNKIVMYVHVCLCVLVTQLYPSLFPPHGL